MKKRIFALLLAAVGKAASHAGQTTLYLTPMHGKAAVLKSLIANIRAGLDHVLANAPQLPTIDRWRALMRYIVNQITAARPQKPSPRRLSTPRLALGSS